MEDYNKIIESLGINFVSVSERSLIRPVTITGYQGLSNTLVLLKKGSVTFGKEYKTIGDGDLLFIPGTKSTQIAYGVDGEVVPYEKFSSSSDTYFSKGGVKSNIKESNICITFEAKLFEAISYFTSLDIPAFSMSGNKEIPVLLETIVEEVGSDRAGKERMVKILTEQIVIEIIRYILDNKLFVEQLATNTTYFKDPRLIDIFKYIKDNLSGDLSNKVLSNVANVSEDYVGQYFKMLTGINPQDYIEYQRMERAVFLLRTSKRSVREIGKDVGYKDTAYFCRRFKMMFGIPAGKMRRREMMND